MPEWVMAPVWPMVSEGTVEVSCHRQIRRGGKIYAPADPLRALRVLRGEHTTMYAG